MPPKMVFDPLYIHPYDDPERDMDQAEIVEMLILRTPSHDAALKSILNQIYPGTEITKGAITLLDGLLSDCGHRLAAATAEVAAKTRATTITRTIVDEAIEGLECGVVLQYARESAYRTLSHIRNRKKVSDDQPTWPSDEGWRWLHRAGLLVFSPKFFANEYLRWAVPTFWTPKTHRSHSPDLRARISTVFHCAHRGFQQEVLPRLPPELWAMVLGQLWSVTGPAPLETLTPEAAVYGAAVLEFFASDLLEIVGDHAEALTGPKRMGAQSTIITPMMIKQVIESSSEHAPHMSGPDDLFDMDSLFGVALATITSFSNSDGNFGAIPTPSASLEVSPVDAAAAYREAACAKAEADLAEAIAKAQREYETQLKVAVLGAEYIVSGSGPNAKTSRAGRTAKRVLRSPVQFVDPIEYIRTFDREYGGDEVVRDCPFCGKSHWCGC
eukprot:m.78444 g.78444  ORF g.78444 m.78444 type:complete len:441 (+) comp10712_c0_seq1:46-1368(+)